VVCGPPNKEEYNLADHVGVNAPKISAFDSLAEHNPPFEKLESEDRI